MEQHTESVSADHTLSVYAIPVLESKLAPNAVPQLCEVSHRTQSR